MDVELKIDNLSAIYFSANNYTIRGLYEVHHRSPQRCTSRFLDSTAEPQSDLYPTDGESQIISLFANSTVPLVG